MRHAIALTAVLAAAPVSAQAVRGRADAPFPAGDTMPARFAWTSVDALVFASRLRGVELWVHLSPFYHPPKPTRFAMDATFDPDAVRAWVRAVRPLVEDAKPGPTAEDSALWNSPPPLVGGHGAAVEMLRPRDAAGRDRSPYLLLVAADPPESLGVRLDSIMAQAFVDTLDARATVSRILPDTETAVPLASMLALRRPVLESQPSVKYPESLRKAGRTGYVVLRFVVDTAGRVERRTIHAILSDDPQFTRAALDLVRGMRFSPGTQNGRPVRVLVELPVNFTLTH